MPPASLPLDSAERDALAIPVDARLDSLVDATLDVDRRGANVLEHMLGSFAFAMSLKGDARASEPSPAPPPPDETDDALIARIEATFHVTPIDAIPEDVADVARWDVDSGVVLLSPNTPDVLRSGDFLLTSEGVLVAPRGRRCRMRLRGPFGDRLLTVEDGRVLLESVTVDSGSRPARDTVDDG